MCCIIRLPLVFVYAVAGSPLVEGKISVAPFPTVEDLKSTSRAEAERNDPFD
jgi:hypothetical protein